MNIIRAAHQLKTDGRKVCAGIGVFDGVHLGHQQVLRQTLDDAQRTEGIPIAITFDRHPNKIVAPERAPAMIYPLQKKLDTIASLGFKHLLLHEFTPEFRRITGSEFIKTLVDEFKTLEAISVGSKFAFGHKRSGNVELLKQLGQENNFRVHGLAAVALDGQSVSSTRIRNSIQSGDINAANQMLGRPYTLCGHVVKGEQVGRKLGFPTANIDTTGLLTPPNGVYATHVKLDKQSHRAALNIGNRPTLAHPEPTLHVEAHLLDFEGDLYGKDLEITFTQKIRPEQKFPNLDALRDQISKDVETTRSIFS